MRHTAIFDAVKDRRSEITTLARDYPAGHLVPTHFHDRDQLVYASRGVMTVRTSECAWVVPTRRAVWIPAAFPHTIAMSGTVAMRTIYFKARLVKTLPRDCCVVNVSPLLKELIVHACNIGTLKKRIRWQNHLIQVIADQLKTIQRVPLQLPNPSDPRALRIVRILLADPSDSRPLVEICKRAGGSKRTIERLFRQETGMTVGRWRQQLRLMQAMRLLAEGAKVTHAALESGYSTPSAFIAMFRKALGTTPSSYFESEVKEP